MKEKIINIIKLIFSLLLFFCSSFIIAIIFNLFGVNINNFGLLEKSLLNFGISLFLTIILIITYFKEIKKDFNEFKLNLKSKIFFALKIFGIFFLLKFFASYISVLISGIFNIEVTTSENQTAINEILEQFPILMSFSAVCLAPIYEEILFRLGFKKCIKNKFLFIIISGCIFGFMHIFPTDLSLGVALTQSITYVAMGLLLAYYYQKFDNIFYSILLHFYNNLLSIVFIFISFIISLF